MKHGPYRNVANHIGSRNGGDLDNSSRPSKDEMDEKASDYSICSVSHIAATHQRTVLLDRTLALKLLLTHQI